MEVSGLDISDLRLRLVRIQKGRKVVLLRKVKELNVPTGCIEDGLIKNKKNIIKLLKTLRRENRSPEIAACLPEKQSFLRVIEVSDKEDVMKAFARHLPFELNSVYTDYTYLGEEKYLAGACKKELVDTYMEVLEASGFYPLKLEVETESVARCVPVQEPTLIADLGLARSSFVMTQNGIAQFSTSFPSLIKEKDAQHILEKELTRILAYCEDHLEKELCPRNIYLCGSGADEKICSVLKTALPLSCKILDLKKFLKKGQNLSPAFATAFGLALGMEESYA